MELFCPECLGSLVTQDGQTARCTLHGGRYRILFARQLPVAEPPVAAQGPADAPPVIGEAPVAPSAPTACARHPQAPVLYHCNRCGAAVCATCEFPQPDGSHWCPDCATGSPPAWTPGSAAYSPSYAASAAAVGAGLAAAPTPTVTAGLGPCLQHPAVPAVAQCRVCGARVCATCDFVFPGNVHLCPRCATQPQTELTPKRKRALRWAYGLAVWCTLGMAVMLSGVLAGTVRTKSDQMALGMVIGLFVFIPSIVGTAMAVSAYDRRLSNPASVWAAIVWNSILLAIYLLLILVGTVSGNG